MEEWGGVGLRLGVTADAFSRGGGFDSIAFSRAWATGWTPRLGYSVEPRSILAVVSLCVFSFLVPLTRLDTHWMQSRRMASM